MTTEQLVDKFIKELQAEGYTPDQMISVFRMAKIKFDLNYRKVYLTRGTADYMDYDGVVKRSKLFDEEKQSFYFYKMN